MCYDLTISENGFSPMDVDELLWVNGGSVSYDRHTETKTTTTTIKNPDGSETTFTVTEKTTTSDFHADTNSSVGQKIQNVWNAIKGWFKKSK